MITVYTRTTCAPCRTLKTYLQRRGIEYTELNVDKNPEYEKDIVERTGFLQVPMTVVGERAIQGLNLPAIIGEIKSVDKALAV